MSDCLHQQLHQGLDQESSDIRIMGVLNCTPDSFSDGGCFTHVDQAVSHGLAMWHAGASIIDVGGESTRPGAAPVSLDEELQRVIPVVSALVLQGCKVSIDSKKAEVMRQAVRAGATLINDVTALADEESLAVAAESGVDVCLMHMQGCPESMQDSPQYDDVLEDVIVFFEERIQTCLAAGIQKKALMLDPGIGFGKRLHDNLTLIAKLGVLKKRLGLPVLMGVSRKSFLGDLTGAEVADRDVETMAAVTICAYEGVDMLRVHDVKATKKAVLVALALRDAQIGLCS